MNKRKLKVIVSIDGGGIRGVLPLLILNHINSLIQRHGLGDDLSSNIDLISGTSTGAIISAGLIVTKDKKNIYSINDLLGLYVARGPQLFNLANPSNRRSEGLRLVLKRKFKGIMLSDLNTKFAFVSYDKTSKLPFVFGRHRRSLSGVDLSTALAACSAVPGYFDPVKINEYELIDGIMAAKNPAHIAYQQARTYFPDDVYLLLSFGTGNLKGAMYDSIEKDVDAVDEKLLQKSELNDNLIYYRFQPDIVKANPQMDNALPENIASLIVDGESYIKENKIIFDRLIADWKMYK
ncbi:patatin-like phospholipase family protein [Brumimicrobium mesophilum]|uniref:patatin-like phospholipase family protein n=1 Tax=Brumimicrobium mesophilum TaxID=392717 RepID=UPI000D141DAE|nr:patatin-like phospholipase family protein [Brumimicrobium mesophilum]